MAIKTYKHGTPFTGVIGRTTEESSPAWPGPPRTPEGAPNALFFVLDDVGYGQLSCFGGLVETPALDSVAANGLRYTNMQTTSVCSPARGQLYINRKLVASIDMSYSILVIFGAQGLTCGYDGGESAAPEEYSGSFPFTGEIKRVTVDLSGELIPDAQADLKIAMARQ